MHPAVSQSALAPRSHGLTPFVVGSLAGHAVLIGWVLALSLLSRPAPLDLNQKPINASLVRLGKRDPKLLPRKEEELPPPPPKVEATPPTPTAVQAPETPAVAIPVPGVKPTPAPPRPRQDGQTSAVDRRKQLFGAFSKNGKAAKLEELEGQLDGDAQGDSAIAEGERYWGLLKAQVQRNYDVSQTLPDTERIHLKALVQLRIGKTGELLQAKLAQPSGNDLFDNAVLSAVKKASPFSPPPDLLRDSLQKTGVVLEFKP